MCPNKIVISKMQGNSGLKVFKLFRESIGQWAQSLHVLAGYPVRPFDIACRDKLRFRMSAYTAFLDINNIGRTVPSFVVMLVRFVSVIFDDHSVISICAKS